MKKYIAISIFLGLTLSLSTYAQGVGGSGGRPSGGQPSRPQGTSQQNTNQQRPQLQQGSQSQMQPGAQSQGGEQMNNIFSQQQTENPLQNENTKGVSSTPEIILQDLNSKSITCKDLSRANYESLGKYFVEQKFSGSLVLFYEHLNYILGDSGTKQYLASLGLRKSGCQIQGKTDLPQYIEGQMSATGTKATSTRKLPPQQNTIKKPPQAKQGGWVYYGTNGGYDGDCYNCRAGGFGWFWSILILSIIGFAMYSIWKKYMHTPKQGEHDKAIFIIRDRFARGEIDRYEYEEKKKLLE